MSKQEQIENRKLAKEQLTEYTNGEYRLYTILRSVSKSGMTRMISVKAIHKGTGLVSHLDWLFNEIYNDGKQYDEGVRVRGCGMDMGFHLIYTGCGDAVANNSEIYGGWL